MLVSTLEIIVEDLKALPTPKLAEAAAYIHRLRETSRANRSAILRETLGSWSSATPISSNMRSRKTARKSMPATDLSPNGAT
jgi:hypothetical protein